MVHNKEKNTAMQSMLATSLFLVVIVLFLFNFNFDIFNANAAQGQIVGEGTPGFIPKWVTPILTTGTLNQVPPPCVIASGQSSCTQTLTWNTVNPIGTSAVTSITGTPSPVNANSGSQSFTAPYNASGVIFELYNNSVSIASTIITTSCAGTTAWNGSMCAPSAGSVTLTANPARIVTGGSSVLEWNSPAGSVCTSANFDVGAGGSTGTYSVNPTSTTTYTVTCDGTSASVTVTFRRKPIFIED